MHISNSAMSDFATSSMSNAYDRYAEILKKITTNKNFTKVSENVVDATRVLKLDERLSQLNEYQGNITHAMNEMELAYQTLGNATDELNVINRLVVEAANGATTPDSAKAIATEIKERVNSISNQMNTKYLDNFIFSGTYINEQPYQKDAQGNITYNGSSKEAGERNLTISEDTTFAYNFTGEEIFGKQDGVNDFFSQMRELDELLNADTLDYEAIREKIGVIEKASDNVVQMTGEVSAKVAKLETTQGLNNDTIVSLTENRAGLEEVDMIKAATDLANAQTSLQASYKIGTTILSSVSLLDYI